MLSCGNRAGTWSGEEPEPKHQPFCRHSCCGMPQSMHLLVGMGCWRRSDLSGVSCADAMKVEGRQCLHPAWLTVFGNKTALSRRLLFYPCLVQWVSVLSLLTLGDYFRCRLLFRSHFKPCDLDFRRKPERPQHPSKMCAGLICMLVEQKERLFPSLHPCCWIRTAEMSPLGPLWMSAVNPLQDCPSCLPLRTYCHRAC